MATLVPDQKTKVDVTLKGTGPLPGTKYQVDYVGPAVTVAPGASGEYQSHLFAGAKIVRMIDLAEYKRKQAAIGLKVTSVAFGSGRRVPIAQGWRAR